MPPTLHATVDWIIFIFGALFCLYLLRALRLARQGARLLLRNLAAATLAFCVAMLIPNSATPADALPTRSGTDHCRSRGVRILCPITGEETQSVYFEGDETGCYRAGP